MRLSLASLLLLVASSASRASLPDTQCLGTPCLLSHPSTCDTLKCKVPLIIEGAVPQGPSIESGLSPEQRTAFEHGLGHALRNTAAVTWTTRKFGSRVMKLIEAVAQKKNTTLEEELLAAFYGDASWPSGSPHNTGFVGPNTTAMKHALLQGNIREVWGLLYVFSKTKFLTHTLLDLHTFDDATLTGLGLNPAPVRMRETLVNATLALDKNHQYNGIPNFLAPSFNSWVRFDFAGPDETVTPPGWLPARVSNGCNETSLMSDDRSIQPPLSDDELRYQCNSTTVPCKLSWYPGLLCYDVPDVPFGNNTAGYVTRAHALGYRIVAGASGTTANMLQLGLILGFEGEEMALLRLTMLAWMLCTNDHSLFEIMVLMQSLTPALSPMLALALTRALITTLIISL